MGASESNPETQGWRILEVIPNGPMWGKGVCVYFDFIVGINGYRLNTSSEEFWDIIKQRTDTEIVLTVFNYKTRIKRDIQMVPNNKWGGDGLLGLVIVRDDFTKCDQQCIRILSVESHSPASSAGLQPQTDYILGTPINAFTSFSVFRDTISDYIDQPLPVYVYNSDKASVRLVEITPSSKWSGEGVLGCQVGDGYLHHIPSLNEEQQTIIYQPNSCYVVSSRNSSKNTGYQSSNPTEKVTPTETKQPQNVETVEQKQVPPQSNENGVTGTSNDVDDRKEEELPTIRWTDSAHGYSHNEHSGDCEEHQHTHTHEHSAQCQHDHHHPSQPIPQQKINLLDQLEQETEKVLAQQ